MLMILIPNLRQVLVQQIPEISRRLVRCGRGTPSLSEEHALIVTQAELRRKRRPVAVVEPGRQADGSGK